MTPPFGPEDFADLPRLEGRQVTCPEHGLTHIFDTDAEAAAALTSHLRSAHRPPLTDVNLTAAARWLLHLRHDSYAGADYAAALGLWTELLGIESDGRALDLAEEYAAAPEPVIATLPPF